jgi:hypothetical protein
MNAGQPSVLIEDNPSVGPLRIEIGQRIVSGGRDIPPTESLLADILQELVSTHSLLTAIHTHLTRPPWWQRLLRRIHVAFSR